MIRLVMAALLFLPLTVPAKAQAKAEANPVIKETVKPFRILTVGRQITVKSTKNIKHVMVWTTDGHRLVEQRDINNTSYSFRIEVKEKLFFVMIQMADGKVFTEKLGLSTN
jgi:hypothetical protein